MKLLSFKKSAAVAAALVGVAVVGLLAASPASASNTDGLFDGLTIEDSVTYNAVPSVDGYLGSTIPEIKCVRDSGDLQVYSDLFTYRAGPNGCQLWVSGAGTVTLDLALSSNATFHYDYTNQRFAVWDKGGNFVQYVDDFACHRNDADGTASLRCQNTDDNFSIHIPSGGNISPVNDSLRRIDLFSQKAQNGETVLTRSLNIYGDIDQAKDVVRR